MTSPDAQPNEQPPTEERPEPAQVPTGPTVTTAPPPRAHRRWSRVPAHVGPARTSTIVLAVLFVGIFVLYLYVKPPSPATAGSPSTPAGTQQPAGGPAPTSTPTATATRTTTPTTTPTSTTASTPARSSSTQPTATTTSGARTTTTAPSETTGAPGGTSGGSTSVPSIPTGGSAPTS